MRKYRKMQWGGQQSGNIPGVMPATQTQFIPSGQGSNSYSPDLKNFYQPEKAEELKKAGLDGDLLKSVMGKGHTNAGNYVIGQAEQAVKQLNQAIGQYGNEFLKTEAGKKLANAAVIDYSVLNKLERDLKNTEDLRKAAEKNNSGSELAITREGKIAAKDKNGNILQISPADYFTGNYVPLSITDLLHEKDINPSLTFASVSSYSDAITGYENAQKHVREMFSNVGEYGFKDSKEAYQAMENALMKISKSGGNVNNLKQVDARLESMMQTLPEQVKNNFLMRAMVNSKSPQEMQHNYEQGFLNYAKGTYTNKSESSQGLDFDAGLTKFKLGRDTEVDVPKTDYFFDLLHATGKVQTEEIDINNGFKSQNQDNTKVDLRNQSMYKAQVTAIPPNEEIRKQLKVFEGKTMSQIKGQKVMWNGQEIDLSKMKDADKILLSSVGEQLIRMPDPNDKLNIQLQAQINALVIKEKEFVKKSKSYNQEEAKLAAQQLPIIQDVIKQLETAKLPSVYVAYNVAAPSSAFSNNSTFQYFNEAEGKLENAVGGFGEKINKSDLFKNEENSEAEKIYKEKFVDSGLGMTGTNDLYTTTVYIKQNNIHYADPTSIRTGYMDALNQANDLRQRIDKSFRTPPSAQLPE